MLRRMKPAELLRFLWRERAIAILRTDDRDRAARALDAAVEGGFRCIEITLNTPHALVLIANLARDPRLVIGAGTVLTPEAGRAAVEAGARFLVSPVMDEELIAEARRLDVAIAPGTATPTEMWRAHRAGAQMQKLFPAPTGGPEVIRSILAPMPFLRILPTNGVDAENAAAYISAGAFAVGFVRSLFAPELLCAGDWNAITARARALRTAAHEAPRPLDPPVTAE
jgi:2-dehydro-3-deoxyphosphogluconate aldolase / (4S)-4-hydroxy-2-oxoglutarate aldolase